MDSILEFTSVAVLDDFFSGYWPRLASSTKQALLVELRPFFGRCAQLLPTLEPQLFPSEATRSTSTSTSSSPTSPTTSAAAAAAASAPPQHLPPASTHQRPRYLTGAPRCVIKAILETSPGCFFNSDGERGAGVVDQYQATARLLDRIATSRLRPSCRHHTDLWLAAIELRFRYLAWYQLREDMIHRGHGGVFHQSSALATRQLSNAAARENPDIPADDIAEEVKLYIERGYWYAHIVEATSVEVLFDLDPSQSKLYERRKSKKQEDQFLSKLALDRASNAAAHPSRRDFIDKLARQAQDYRNFQRGRLAGWLDERMDGSAADVQNLENHDPRGNKRRKTSSSGGSTASSASPLPPQSASMFQVQPWRISTVMRPWSEPFSATFAPMTRSNRAYRPGQTRSLGETEGAKAVSSATSRSTPLPRPSTERTLAKNAPDIQIKPSHNDRKAGSSDKLPTAATSRQRSLPNIRDTIDDIYVLAARRQPNISRDPPVAAKPSFKIGSVEVLDFGAADAS